MIPCKPAAAGAIYTTAKMTNSTSLAVIGTVYGQVGYHSRSNGTNPDDS
jgi:hypothetical protein